MSNAGCARLVQEVKPVLNAAQRGHAAFSAGSKNSAAWGGMDAERQSTARMTPERIPWAELCESPAKAEQLFDLIMHAVYGDRVVTTNGAGGDGGIDAWIADIRRAVELKGFTTLGTSQRAQVTRSLTRASANPKPGSPPQHVAVHLNLNADDAHSASSRPVR